MNEIIKKSIKSHLDLINKIDNELLDVVNKSSKLILERIKSGGTIFWCGNGGSSSQASHLSAELLGGMYKKKIKPFKSICINTDTSFITAWSNDDSFNNIFSRQLEGLAIGGDIIILLSTSGNSQNILSAAQYANQNEIKVISLTGFDGGKIKKISDININIASKSTQRIQEMHILVGHIICDIIESSF